MNKQANFSNGTIPIMTLLNDIKNIRFGGLDLQPEYQRGYIWKNGFKDKLIYSIIMQYPIGNINIRVLNNPNDKGAKREIVDGQQRLSTIRDFVNNNYEIKGEWAEKIIQVIKEYYDDAGEKDEDLDKLVQKLNKNKIKKFKYKDLPKLIQDNINAFNIAVIEITNSNDEQIREYFRFLQNQEILRAGEIINSIPPTNLEDILLKVKDKNKLLNIIGFKDNREEFNKIFYSLIGLYDKKINFGVADKVIQNYASNAPKPTVGLSLINNMVNNINYITNVNGNIVNKTRKRYLKYLLLLAGFNNLDFKNNSVTILENLKLIDDKLTSFFSAKNNAVENTFVRCTEKCISDLREVALISKGSQTFASVSKAINLLEFYINNINEVL